MRLTTKQKTVISALSVIIGAGIVFTAFEYVPKITGKVFLIAFAVILIKWVNDFIKHERDN